MKRFLTVLSALVLCGCSSMPQPLTAQVATPAPDEPVPTLHVNATATVRRAPDVAVVQLAVETMASTARAATDQNTARMEDVLAAVRSLGIPSSRIRTQRLELQPRYGDRRNNADPEIIGYRAVNQVTVRLLDVMATGPVVDAAVSAGANRVSGIQFELADPEAAYHEALRNAIAKARAEAEVAAAALGKELGEPLTVSTGGYNAPTPRFRMESAVAMDQAGAPPVEPGEIEVQATVSIAWRLGS